jgi:hypothetical protein
MLGLSQHAGHLLISCPCQQVLPSARSYPYTCTTSTLASCLRTRNTGHVCEWLTTCDFRQHISSHLLCLSFLQARYGDFNIYQLSGQRCLWRLWSASYLYEQRCATQHHGVQRVWIKLGSPQSWAALDVNPKTTYHIPKMMNICGCMGLLFIPVWDPDWAWQVVGISAVQPLVA